MKRITILVVFCIINIIAWGQTEPVKIFIRGTGLNRNESRVLIIGDNTVYDVASGRGLRLTIINKSNQSIVSDISYDCYGSSASSESLANSLNSINNEQIGILTSWDAWEHNVSASLDAAFYRLGLTIAGGTINNGSRRPYAAIFEGASNGEKSGKVVEVSCLNTANQPYAEIRGFLYRGSFIATGNQSNALMKPQGDGCGVLVDYNGNVGVGTLTPGTTLDVAGTIRAKEIKVEAQTADFVFDEDYNLLDLNEVEKFIKENKHLPDIPSAAEMEATGVNLAEMNKLLLQKIEELTLYAIEKDKETSVLKCDVEKLVTVNKDLVEYMKSIEKDMINLIQQYEELKKKLKVK